MFNVQIQKSHGRALSRHHPPETKPCPAMGVWEPLNMIKQAQGLAQLFVFLSFSLPSFCFYFSLFFSLVFFSLFSHSFLFLFLFLFLSLISLFIYFFFFSPFFLFLFLSFFLSLFSLPSFLDGGGRLMLETTLDTRAWHKHPGMGFPHLKCLLPFPWNP